MAKSKTNTPPKPKFYMLVSPSGVLLAATALCVKCFVKSNYAPLQSRFDLRQWLQVSEGVCGVCPDDGQPLDNPADLS